MNRKWRLYLDTSVFGGCFDAAEGWDGDSRRVVDYCAEGTALLLSSETLEKELKAAPKQVRKLYEDIADEHRIRAFNAVNLGEGYGVIMIISPKEVNLYE